MHTREEIMKEIALQELPYDALSERQQKSLISSILMKSIYEPLPFAVAESFKPFSKELDKQREATQK